MDLIADIGATNTRCALLDDRGNELAPEVFHNADFTGVPGLLNVYLDHRRTSDRPKRAALAVAAPIVGDDVRMINIDWRFSQAELKQELDLSRLLVVNDFAAVAWALPHFAASDLRKIGGGAAEPGTIARSDRERVSAFPRCCRPTTATAIVSGEGGHATLPATTDEEAAVIASSALLRASACSTSVLSGPGLVNLYVALAQLAGSAASPLSRRVDVTSLAKQGEPLARKAQEMFFAMLGTVAADLALTFGARGGVFIGGGIVPKLLPAIAKSQFRERFEARGDHRDYVSAIPTHVITAATPAFRGLRRLLGYG